MVATIEFQQFQPDLTLAEKVDKPNHTKMVFPNLKNTKFTKIYKHQICARKSHKGQFYPQEVNRLKEFQENQGVTRAISLSLLLTSNPRISTNNIRRHTLKPVLHYCLLFSANMGLE